MVHLEAQAAADGLSAAQRVLERLTRSPNFWRCSVLPLVHILPQGAEPLLAHRYGAHMQSPCLLLFIWPARAETPIHALRLRTSRADLCNASSANTRSK